MADPGRQPFLTFKFTAMNILVSDCCGAEQDDFYPDVCPRCREHCVFASVIDEPNPAEIESEEEDFPSFGLSDEDERKANEEDIDEDDQDLDDLPGNWEPDYDGTTAREQQLSAYNQKF